MTASGKSDNGHNASAARLSRVLVVDDEELIRVLVAEILGRMGCEVTMAADGGEAVAALDRESFDLIITDLVMPILDGVEVLRRAKRMHPECPVIVMTGHPSAGMEERMAGLGAADYITKPFGVTSLMERVARHLQDPRA